MNNDKLTFELALDRINEIAALLSAGHAELAEALALYEEAQALVNRCRELLTNAELKLIEITDSAQLEAYSEEK